jgi:hypothetical protein
MNEEELQTTMMKTMMIEQDVNEEEDVIESIEEFEERLDYLDISDEKKEKLKKLCLEIKKEEDIKTRDYLFNLLKKEID